MPKTLCFLVIALLSGFSPRPSIGADNKSPEVVVDFAKGQTKLGTLKEGVTYFSNRRYELNNLPQELAGLIFTVRDGGLQADVSVQAPAGSKVFLLVDSDKSSNADAKVCAQLAADGWHRLHDAEYIVPKKHPFIAVFERDFREATKFNVAGGGWSGVVVASTNLALKSNNAEKVPDEKKDDEHKTTLHDDPAANTAAAGGPATRPAMPQTSIRCLEVYIEGSGAMLGQTSETTLTLTPGKEPKQIAVRFITKIGNEMSMARDEALRYIRITYPNWYVDNAEITFEDKYIPHDGGSIGTAVGTMILSCIQGVQIDPNAAITGDISANGKVRAIGGVAAKLRGAIASKCTLAAVPMENYDQVVDAMVYYGPGEVADIQVIGIGNLNDALATMRVDRDAKLKQAIDAFAAIQNGAKEAKDKPAYWKSKKTQDDLAAVLALAPQHISAKILLEAAKATKPQTLSATATHYYTAVAVAPMLAVLKDRAKAGNNQVASTAVQKGLIDLKKLLPIADPNVRPLITAWANFIQSWSDFQQGSTSGNSVESRRQALQDEMVKEQTNADMMQKMVKEGI